MTTASLGQQPEHRSECRDGTKPLVACLSLVNTPTVLCGSKVLIGRKKKKKDSIS